MTTLKSIHLHIYKWSLMSLWHSQDKKFFLQKKIQIFKNTISPFIVELVFLVSSHLKAWCTKGAIGNLFLFANPPLYQPHFIVVSIFLIVTYPFILSWFTCVFHEPLWTLLNLTKILNCLLDCLKWHTSKCFID
jgi:uncharacterized membrane protein